MQTYTYCPWCGAKLATETRDGRERKVCRRDDCGFVFWDNPLPVVAAIVDFNGRVILARNRAWPEGMFGLITGFLEKDETPEEGVVREVDEELGLQGEVVSCVGVYPFTQRNQVLLVYHVRAQGTISLGEELAEFREIELDNVKPWPFGTGLALRDWLLAQGIDVKKEGGC